MVGKGQISLTLLRDRLEQVYKGYNRKELVDPDPLYFLYGYGDSRDREVVGLVAACLAYGRVEMIMKTVDRVLETLGPRPAQWLASHSRDQIFKAFPGFVYRFTRQEHLAALLQGIKSVHSRYGTMEACLIQGLPPRDTSLMSGLSHLYQELDPDNGTGHLLADPTKGSACKRTHLFLRWMVRRDAVDPGGWDRVSPAGLTIPLDTHMFRIGTFLKFTTKKSPGRNAALDITAGFRTICPEDPVKYDFALTRFGIRRNLEMDELEKCLTMKHAELPNGNQGI